MHKVLPSTTLYIFVLQSLHKALPSTMKLAQVRPSTTLYYKPCTKYVLVLLCTTKLAQRKLLHRSFYTQQAFTHSKLLHTAHYFTQSAFTHEKLLHTERLLHTASFYRNKITQRSFLVHNDNKNCSSKTGWISAPKRKKDDFEALFKRNFTRKITTPIRFTMSSCKRQ